MHISKKVGLEQLSRRGMDIAACKYMDTRGYIQGEASGEAISRIPPSVAQELTRLVLPCFEATVSACCREREMYSHSTLILCVRYGFDWISSLLSIFIYSKDC